ncbi:PE-PPE domain-containing protein [Mycobacterium sp. 852002-51057_SCH5723018]|uniref:PE family protein n=1 Tax=Mycobacterium sp. 852002-51057_SCH5723018 TaxID=1834094 RepID=UPI0007FE8A24|nr:PE-PPE domain-containing protein [Mycobacterium sp. 852002-51057_SCH5723018]OBG23825.1 hypothetical protein A5764_10090 [Mycobacterium sp. 852002-51057_SCH5723018]
MTTLITQPQILATAAQDASAISSAIDEARAAAAGPTTTLAAAAEDEVSAITAQFFGTFGQEYQALLTQATAFHNEFAATLAAAGNTYAQAEAQIAASLGLSGGASAAPVFGFSPPADPQVSQILVMGASGFPNPTPSYIAAVRALYLGRYTPNNTPLTPFINAVTTAEGLYPFTGTKDLTLDISLARGVTSLETAISQSFAAGASSLGVFGYSQSAIIASVAMPQLHNAGYTANQLFFTLIGDPSNPNGGLFARFPGLSLPSLGVTFGTSTPSDLFHTTIYTLEYDGFADFPQYPIDFLSDLNALAGIVFVHGTYPELTPTQVGQGFLLPGSESLGTSGSLTDYYMIPTANLPLLEPLRALPLIGNPLADLVQPDLRYLVNWGYGDPNFGFSTGPANIQTPFGFLPPLSATTALGPLLVSGTQQGIGAFAGDLSAMVPTSPPSLSLSSLTSLLPGSGSTGGAPLTLPTLTSIPSINDIIAGIQSANTNIVGTLTTDFSTAYSTLLPTADIGTALVVSIPSYDVNLFLNGISEAVSGNPIQGLMDAFGDPIAANVGLTTLAGGFEFLSIENSLDTILTGHPNPGID